VTSLRLGLRRDEGSERRGIGSEITDNPIHMTKSTALSDVIIELHVPDFDTVKDFYGTLGFKTVWEYPPEGQSGYLVMRREKSILTFFCGNEEVYNHSFFKQFPKTTTRGYGIEICIYISDRNINDYYKDILPKISKESLITPLETKPWGSKDFRIADPFGYYLCIREASNILHE
jgi:catechol 2,3-dioxygenase-like lactoylglutathione lyase family enzyme